MDSRNVAPTPAAASNVDKEKFMAQIDTLTTMLTTQTLKLMEAEKTAFDAVRFGPNLSCPRALLFSVPLCTCPKRTQP